MVRGVLLVVILSCALLGCGPSDAGATAPKAYAHAVCDGLATWQQGITADSTRLTQDLQAAAAVSVVRARYARFYSDAVRRTDTLLVTVRRAGAPKVDHGTGYARDLTAALSLARASLQHAKTRFAALSTSNLRAYAAGAAAIRDELGTAFVGVGTALDRLGRSYPDKTLNKAFAGDPRCTGLT